MDVESFRHRVHRTGDVLDAFAQLGRKVVTFGGFGELGYEDEERVLNLCAAELRRLDPACTLINTGTLITEGFQAGIAMVYPLAKKMGFATTGVHPAVALDHPKRHSIASGVDYIFFVEDETWGGFDSRGMTSNTLHVLLNITDEFIVLGGGDHTAQELTAFMAAGKPVRFHKAAMHVSTTDQWCADSGVRFPDYWGSAYRVWNSRVAS